MAPDATILLQLVLPLIWTCFNMGRTYPLFSKVLSSQVIREQLFAFTTLVFAPGLLEDLQASTPPTISWFKSLPTDDYAQWAIYRIVLEKLFCRLKINIGSGTKAHALVRTRFSKYDRRSRPPIFADKALKDWYNIVHKRDVMLDSYSGSS
jgi:hypothetical protein